MTRKDAIQAMLSKYNDSYSTTRYYREHLAWNTTVKQMAETVNNARKVGGSFAKAIELANINAEGIVYVNGINCGRIG